MPRENALSLIFLMLSGLLVWAAHFLFVYVFAALACARQFAGAELFGFGIVPATVLIATAVALVLLGGLALLSSSPRSFRIAGVSDHTSAFMRGFALLAHAISLVAILYSASALIVPACT